MEKIEFAIHTQIRSPENNTNTTDWLTYCTENIKKR